MIGAVKACAKNVGLFDAAALNVGCPKTNRKENKTDDYPLREKT